MSSFTYTGVPSLEVMSEAVCYNNFLETTLRDIFSASAQLLDFGAGTGEYVRRLARTHTVDALEADAALAQRLSPPARRAYTSLTDVPAAHYDGIYTINVMEHIEDDGAVLRTLSEKLKPGGILAVYVPALPLLYSSIDRAIGHYRRYTRADLCAKISAAGLDIQRAAYVDSIGMFAWWIMKTLRPNQQQLPRGGVIFFDRFIFPLSRILDRLTQNLFGKNLLVVAVKR